MDSSDYLINNLVHDMRNSPTLLEFQKSDPEKMFKYVASCASVVDRYRLRDFISTLVGHKELHELIPGFVQLSVEDQYRLTIWENATQLIRERYSRRG